MKAKLIFTVLLLGLLTSSFSQKIVWKPKAELPKNISGGTAVTDQDKTYHIGGRLNGYNTNSNSLFEYNLAINEWAEKPDMPTERQNLSVTMVDGKIYAMGGDLFIDKNEMYDPLTETWQALAPMPTARQHIDGCTINGIIYIAGGLESWSIVSNKVEAYNPNTNSWTSPTTLPVPKHNYIIAAHNNEIYVMGGNINDENIWSRTKSVEIYNINTNTWRNGPDMPQERAQSRTVVYNNEIYIFGGWVNDNSDNMVVTNSVLIYNPEAETWRTTTSTPLPINKCGTTLIGNNIYLMGGYREGVTWTGVSENLEGTIINEGNFVPEVYYPLVDDSCTIYKPFIWILPEFTFIDDDTLNYSASLTNGNELPTWLSFDIEDRIFTGTPDKVDTLSIIIKATDNYDESVQDTITFIVKESPTGITNFKKEEDLLVFPNPAKNYIKIRTNNYNFKNKNFQILTVDGKIIIEGRLESEGIEISDLNKGIFILNIQTDNKIITKKIVVE